MSEMVERVARAIIVAGYNPATAENIARIAIEAVQSSAMDDGAVSVVMLWVRFA